MNLKDELRCWIKEQLKLRGRGTRARLAEYLNLTPMQISHMLSTKISRKNRNIQAEELLQILRFFGIKIGDPFLSLEKPLGNNASAAQPALPADKNPGRTVLIHIYDNAEPKQREAIVNLVRALAEAYNIPH